MYRNRVIGMSLLAVIALASLPVSCQSGTPATTSKTVVTSTTPVITTPTTTTTSVPVTTSTPPPVTTSMVITSSTPSTTLPSPVSTTIPPTTSSTPPTTTTASPTLPTTTTITTIVPTTTAQIVRLPDMLDPAGLLPSYRYYVITKILEGDGAGSTSTYRYETIRDQRAEHAWKEDSTGKVTELFIIIGSDQWTYVTGQGWVKQAPPTAFRPVNVSAQITAVMKDPAASKASAAKLGQESKNNTYSAHFQIEYTVKQQVPNPSGTGTSEVDAHTTGDVWIAENLGVPSIIMLWKGTTDYTLQGKKTVIYTEQSLYDIDRLTEIFPPKT